ncbi:aminopeptidase [archaeon]
MHDDGTDLSFSVKGRRFMRDDAILDEEDIRNKDVGMNLPAGEIFTAPREYSANGILKIPKNIIPGHGIAEEIEFLFEKGKVVDYGAKKHRDYLTKFFAENTGECRRIAELGIGCNSKAEFTDGYIIVDEKIKGTLHIAIGWNIGYGGKNNASSHLDFIKPMYNGSLYADGALVMHKGKLVA